MEPACFHSPVSFTLKMSAEEEEIGVSQNPPAPPDELFDISTTVDPSYVISLIRKLLPPTTTACDFGSNDCWVGNESWEEHGCILWDLATSGTHAELMVQNLVLEVILATLTVSQSPRVTEISLGILGNLACHEVSRKQIVTVKGLIEIIVDQLFVDDTPSLCEEFRLLTLCLQGSEAITWAHALQPENVVSRILWIVENTLNPQLIEKSVGFLLTISESEDEVRGVVLPHLVKLGLPNILINLLAFEISKLPETERYSVLDTLLRAIEALQQLCSSKRLFNLLVTLIKLADKFEVANSCVTAAVLIANLLSESDDLILEMKHDLVFLQGLLDIFPLASDEIEARNALWDIISRLLGVCQQQEEEIKIISILASKLDLIEEELLYNQLASHKNLTIRTSALKRIDCIASQVLTLKDEYLVNERDLDRLKECCRRYSSNGQ